MVVVLLLLWLTFFFHGGGVVVVVVDIFFLRMESRRGYSKASQTRPVNLGMARIGRATSRVYQARYVYEELKLRGRGFVSVGTLFFASCAATLRSRVLKHA